MNSTHVKVLGMAALAVALGACKPPAEAKKDEVVERTVTTAPVSAGTLVDRVEVTGELQGVEEVRVFSQVPERIVRLAVKEGEKVRAGDLLATIRSDLQSEGVNQAQAMLEAALANRDALRDNLERVRQLAKAGSAPPSQLETLEAQSRAADAQVRQATAAVASATAQQSRTIVSAPISGVVSQIALREGDMASPGMPIMTIVKAERLKAVLRVPERDFLRVHQDQPVQIEPLADASVHVAGSVTVRGPVIDRMTRTGLVEVWLDNKDGHLLAGAAVRASIEVARHEGVLLVPAEAVILDADTERTGEATAFVAEGKVAKLRKIHLGARQESTLEVTQGLKPGEVLVVRGSHLLRDNNPIALQEQRAETAR